MVNAYPVAGKTKSLDICRAFVDGVKDHATDCAVFYGVDQSNSQHWDRVKTLGIDWYYIDNSYFDATRGTHFRVTRNGLQHSGLGHTTGVRFRQLRQKIMPWRVHGNHILVCPQSDQFMREIAHFPGNWLQDVQAALATLTVRPLRVRNWDRDKAALSATLRDDLRGAWALVTYSSAAAVSALIEGVPPISKAGACAYMGNNLSTIEKPRMREDRERFLGVLADNQFTLQELREGKAWRTLVEA